VFPLVVVPLVEVRGDLVVQDDSLYPVARQAKNVEKYLKKP
jgi:hypothetical protein